MEPMLKNKRVFVGLSGGVDSAVTAALLKEAGASATAVFIKGWYPPGLPCTWASERRDAMRIAAYLELPFVTLDASKEYKNAVIDYLLAEYAAGRTPNPDIMCNRDVKFGVFYAFAREHGADYIATGHYVQTREGRLYRGIDESKDQSYFLWAVPGEALFHTLFPLGALKKSAVREKARKLKLPVADKKDSQGICFLGSVSVEDFLKSELGVSEGKALAESGEEIGVHAGAVLYTLGERVALVSATPGPWYVVRKNLADNTITVSRERLSTASSIAVRVREANWFKEVPIGRVLAQVRYHGPRTEGNFDNNVFTPLTDWPEQPVAGQSLVLYKGEECVGGGIIE